MKKKIIITTALLAFILGWSSLSSAESASVFNGKKYTAKITQHCAEGNVSCEDVTFDSRSKATGKGIVLKGKTVGVNCPDVCDFAGYEFHNGAYKYYFVSGNNNLWDLNIFKNGKVISTDIGTME
ncbi:hypothetical protein [Erwinia sp. ErVv1]|uniref:hypothetical protein n=1 Tax=Erwinia sp. ErVv1 TaxID=1603299 RepID=UPI00082C0886|nr:hypothetical protein [Erwinia sp. ErVv1]